MYIYLLFANDDIIGAYRSKEMAEMDRDLLEEVPVSGTEYTVEEVLLSDG